MTDIASAGSLSPSPVPAAPVISQESNDKVVWAGRMPYDAALDGVRALAVVAVMFYHADVAWAQGGFLGVDLFFVLSGYLITTLLIREEKSDGRIDLVSFWGRRLRRLMPALLLMVVWVMIYARWISPESAADNGTRSDIVATLLYVANWWNIAEEASYFALFTEQPALLHTWSLAIEEQWYLFWPVVVWFWARSSSRMDIAAMVCGGAALFSALLMALFADSEDPSRAFFGTDTRGQALLVGAALAFALGGRLFHAGAPGVDKAKNNSPMWAIGVLGLVLFAIFVVAVADDQMWMYRGGFLLAAIASGLLIVGVRVWPESPLAQVLALEPLPAIGRISYGLYLWHWPIFILLNEERTGLDGVALVAFKFVTTFVVAIASYNLVEQPVRKATSARWAPLGLVAAAVVLAGAAFAVVPATKALAPGETVRIQSPSIGAANSASSGEDTNGSEAAAETDEPGTDTEPGSEPGSESSAEQGSEPDADRGTREPVPDNEPSDPDGPGDATAPAVDSNTPAPVDEPDPATPAPTPRPVRAPGPPIRALLLGDSISLEMAMSYDDPADLARMSLDADVKIGCGTIRDDTYDFCLDRTASWGATLAEADPEVIIIALSPWDAADVIIEGIPVTFGTPAYEANARASWDKNLEVLAPADVPIVIVSLACLTWVPELQPTVESRVDPVRTARVNEVTKSVIEQWDHDVHWIDIRELTCPDGEYRETLNGVPVHRDGVHFSDQARPIIWDWLLDRIEPLIVG